MPTTITLTGATSISLAGINARTLTQVGGYAVQVIRDRVAEALNANDAPARAYSSRGPIYIPVYGVGRTKAGKTRSKTNLGGVFGFSKRDIKVSKQTLGRGRKTIRYDNYTAFKRALGKSGNRDLQLSGRMLNAIAIVEQAATAVTIGFTRQEEALKAAGNQRRDPWFAFSPRDQAKIRDFAAARIGLTSSK